MNTLDLDRVVNYYMDGLSSADIAKALGRTTEEIQLAILSEEGKAAISNKSHDIFKRFQAQKIASDGYFASILYSVGKQLARLAPIFSSYVDEAIRENDLELASRLSRELGNLGRNTKSFMYDFNPPIDPTESESGLELTPEELVAVQKMRGEELVRI